MTLLVVRHYQRGRKVWVETYCLQITKTGRWE